MRVIAGDRKGFKLKSPKGREPRPTEDFIKEMIFNIIQPVRTGTVVCDCFAGTGSIGIEFLSRGAKKCYFTDISKENIKLINENLEHTKFLKESVVLQRDAVGAISGIYEPVDYFYLDPPYDNLDLLEETLSAIDKSDILKPNTLVIAETTEDFERDFSFEKLILKDIRKKRKKRILFFEVKL